MGLVDAVKSGISNYANFSGRASRSELWWFILFYVLVVFALSFLMGMSSMFGYVLMAFYLGIIIPIISVTARRMHDTDHSGWFMLIPIYSLYLEVIKGTDGPNRFGDDPLG